MTTTPSKSYELTFVPHEKYLYALIRSERMTLDIAREYLTEVAEKCSELKLTRLLLERDVPVMLPVGELFETTNYFLDLMRGKRVAFVNPHEPIIEEMEFAILIGNNRGAHYHLFNNLDAAEAWLIKS